MRGNLICIAILSILAPQSSAIANVLVEHSFQQKMAESDVVIVGTVLAINPSNGNRLEETATVRAVAVLKGSPPHELFVRTQARIAEERPHCCEIGATYTMFLWRTSEGNFASVNGRYGLVRIGPAANDPLLEPVH